MHQLALPKVSARDVHQMQHSGVLLITVWSARRTKAIAPAFKADPLYGVCVYIILCDPLHGARVYIILCDPLYDARLHTRVYFTVRPII